MFQPLEFEVVRYKIHRLGRDGFWKKHYGWGVRVSRHFGARWFCTELGTL